ncbi:cytochrome b-c1 complex subunit 2, mitochondrial-like [Homarus americanus]|uniref:cytochrome b-c1 complex subunit 2, mitochondrial-like n=1 Tax=Homarus americanus TaxID=6706 RepID=UPI001C447D7B|nr:cytochrome b-c1 complex subunit 2, mitochondrial-like [Homarus americanus]
MASKAAKPSLLKSVVNRGFAAQAAAQQSSYTLPQHNSKVTTLPSGTVVASLENNAPVSHVALLFKAGSRYESASNQGAAHMLRACAGLATNNTTSFAITRTIQQAGGSLSAESGREHILYGLDVIRDNLDAGLEILREVGTQPAFKPWEIKSCVGRIKNELALRDPSIIAVELLHSAAFRNTGLGNSIFLPSHNVGKLNSDMVSFFVFFF